MDPIEIALRAVGTFYVFAGYVAARAGLVSHLLDEALAGIAAKPVPSAERARTYWLLGSTVLVLAGGTALLLLLDLAPWLFALSALGQLVYLVWLAPRYFDAEDPPDAKGRRQTTNAFVIYLAATALTIWAAAAGRLVPWRELPWPLLVLGLALVLAHAGYVLSGLGGWRRGGASPATAAPSLEPQKVMLSAVPDGHPLQAMDEHLVGDVDPASLGLSQELCRELCLWSAAFCGETARAEAAGELPSQQVVESLMVDARTLARCMKLERPDLIVYVEEPGYGPIEITAPEPEEGDGRA